MTFPSLSQSRASVLLKLVHITWGQLSLQLAICTADFSVATCFEYTVACLFCYARLLLVFFQRSSNRHTRDDDLCIMN